MREDLIKRLIFEKTSAEVHAIDTLVGGQVGYVYRVDTSNKSFVVKLVDSCPEPPYFEELYNDRVYGSRWSNLLPAYGLLKRNGIRVPKLYASGYLESEKLNYVILDYLRGDSDDYSVEWFSEVGNILGTIHKISRPFQGWINMEKPYEERWSSAFTKCLKSELMQAEVFLSAALHTQVTKQVTESGSIIESKAFVLSHTDGFQGVLKKEIANWALVGVVDIEDYQFTDQRFVLAGFELSHVLEKRIIPDAFWKTYSKLVPIDPTFDTSKKLFQLYYLLVWLRVLINQPEPFKKCLNKLSEMAD